MTNILAGAFIAIFCLILGFVMGVAKNYHDK